MSLSDCNGLKCSLNTKFSDNDIRMVYVWNQAIITCVNVKSKIMLCNIYCKN